jgi:hypothetical protein
MDPLTNLDYIKVGPFVKLKIKIFKKFLYNKNLRSGLFSVIYPSLDGHRGGSLKQL